MRIAADQNRHVMHDISTAQTAKAAAWIAALTFVMAPMLAADTTYLLYAGGFSGNDSLGIYGFRFDEQTGKLTALGLSVEAQHPTYFAIDPTGNFLYAVVNKRESIGGLSSYRIDRATGKLTLLNTVSSRGINTCFVSISHSGKYALVANYASGSVASYPIMPDGNLKEASSFVQHYGSSINRERQAGPHAHSINVSPDDRFAIAADLGTDQLFVYRFQGGQLAPNDPPYIKLAPGSGPRHFIFDRSGQHAYAVEEIASEMTVFDYDAHGGGLRKIQTISMLPPGFSGTNAAADVQVHPSGKFVYGSNRGDDSIAVFAVDRASGKLKLIENAKTGGKTPRIFAIDPSGRFLIAANEGSSTLAVLRIDPVSGGLKDTGERAAAPNPTCVKFAGAMR